MSTSVFCYQPKAYHLCAEGPQHALSEIAGRASPFQQGGWPRDKHAACLGVLKTLYIGRSSYYHFVKARLNAKSDERFHDVNNPSPALWPSDGQGYTRTLRQCNALPSSKSLRNVRCIDRSSERLVC